MAKFRGNNRFAAALTAGEVQRLRSEYDTGKATQGELSRKYKISVVQVGRIVRRESWQWVEDCEVSEADLNASAARMLQLQESVTKRMNDSIAAEKEKETRGDALLEELTTGAKDGQPSDNTR